jgi:ribosomal protein S18 acetylase RimI-like enzyme
MADQQIQLRAARPEDAPAIAEIWRVGWADGHLGRVPAELVAVRDAESFRTRAAQRVADTTVAVVGDEVAGFVMVVEDEVEQVYVAGQHRGAGVADALLDAAERRIGDAGHRMAWLAVVPGNARARRFYERHGWRDAGLFEYVVPSGNGPIPVPCHRYVKDLPAAEPGR